MLRQRFEELIQTADTLRGQELYDEAIDSYGYAVALAQEKSFRLHDFEVAEINFKIGQTAVAAFGIEEALDVYNAVMLSFNDDPILLARAHYEIGKAYLDIGDAAAAQENINQALRCLWREPSPENPFINEGRVALSALLLGKRRAARDHLGD